MPIHFAEKRDIEGALQMGSSYVLARRPCQGVVHWVVANKITGLVIEVLGLLGLYALK